MNTTTTTSKNPWFSAPLLPASALVAGARIAFACYSCGDPIKRSAHVRVSGDVWAGEAVAQHAKCWDMVYGD
jgi:hypothetical protein